MIDSDALSANAAASRLLPTLLANAPLMNFLRFCELIELAAPQCAPLGTTDSPAGDPVRFRSHGKLGFPSREIHMVERDGDVPDAPPVVRTTFLGLYGVDARMPSYFVDEIAQRRDGAEPLAAFLDLFHHRIVTQFYRVARKYRYPMGFRPGGRDEVSRCLLSLLGLGFGTEPTSQRGDAAEPLEPRRLLSMLGLGTQRTRTTEGLASVLKDAVPDAHVKVEEFYPVWVRLDQGDHMPLGENCVLGGGFYDRANAVRVVITPQSRETVLCLMPGKPLNQALIGLLRFYLGYAAHAHLEMHVRPTLMPAPGLRCDQVRLGFTTQLPAAACADGDASRLSTSRITRVRLGIWSGSHACVRRR